MPSSAFRLGPQRGKRSRAATTRAEMNALIDQLPHDQDGHDLKQAAIMRCQFLPQGRPFPQARAF
jgi:hypothetical protein